MLLPLLPACRRADRFASHEIEVHGPVELQSHLGLVQVCIRMAGGSCSLGTVEVVSASLNEAVVVKPEGSGAAMVGELPCLGLPQSGLTGTDNSGARSLAAGDVLSTLRRNSFSFQNPTAPCPFYCFAVEEESELEQESEDESSVGSGSGSGSCTSDSGITARAPAPEVSEKGPRLHAAAEETAELLRSCFLMAPLPSVQPQLSNLGHQQLQQQCRRPSGRPSHAHPAGIATQPSPVQQQWQQEGVNVDMHLARTRSKSDDGGPQEGPRLKCIVPPLKSLSLQRQSSSRGRRMQAVSGGGAATMATGLSHGGLDALSRRMSTCSTATLASNMSCRSSSVWTSSASLYERMSLHSEWSCLSTRTCYGSPAGCGGSCGSSTGGMGTGITEPNAQRPSAAAGGLMALSPEYSLRSDLYSGAGTTFGSAATTPCLTGASDVVSPEYGSSLASSSVGQHSLATASSETLREVEYGAAATASAKQHPQNWSLPSFKLPALMVPESQLSAELNPDGAAFAVDTPRLVGARPTLPWPPSVTELKVSTEIGSKDGPCAGAEATRQKPDLQPLRLQLPVLPHAGLALLEATGGHCVAACWPLLVVETEAQRDEVVGLWQEFVDVGRADSWREFAEDLGLVLGSLSRCAGVLERESVLVGGPAGDCPAISSSPGQQSPAALGSAPLPLVEAAVPGTGESAVCSAAASTSADGVSVQQQEKKASRQSRVLTEVNDAGEHGLVEAFPYCESVLSSESAYQESWGTGVTIQSVSLDQTSANGRTSVASTALLATRSGSGIVRHLFGSGSGNTSTSTSNDGDGGLPHTVDCLLASTAVVVAEVPDNSSVSLAAAGLDDCSGSGSPPHSDVSCAAKDNLAMIGAYTQSVDETGNNADTMGAFSCTGELTAVVDLHSGGITGTESGTESKEYPVEQPPGEGCCSCALHRSDEMALLTSGLGPIGDSNGGNHPGVKTSSLKSFLEGLQMVTGLADDDTKVKFTSGTKPHVNSDFNPVEERRIMQVACPLAGSLSAGRQAAAEAPVQGLDTPSTSLPPLLNPPPEVAGTVVQSAAPMLAAATIGLSVRARAALQEALLRLLGFVEIRCGDERQV